MRKWYMYKFADGSILEAPFLTKDEIRIEERTHGKLLYKKVIGSF